MNLIQRGAISSHVSTFLLAVIITGAVVFAVMKSVYLPQQNLNVTQQLQQQIELLTIKLDEQTRLNEELKLQLQQKIDKFDFTIQQKQALENNQMQIESDLSALQKERNQLVEINGRTIQSNEDLQSRIEAKNIKISELETQLEQKNKLLGHAELFFNNQAELKKKISEQQLQLTEEKSNLAKLEKECQLLLDGTSWDAKSDACVRKKALENKIAEQQLKIDAWQQQVFVIEVNTP
jgi:chromosome segregation ATPase